MEERKQQNKLKMKSTESIVNFFNHKLETRANLFNQDPPGIIYRRKYTEVVRPTKTNGLAANRLKRVAVNATRPVTPGTLRLATAKSQQILH